MTQQSARSIRNLLFLKLSVVLGGLLLSAGCYTQLHTSYSEREPDHQTITEYTTEFGDSVVVDNFYYEDSFYHYHPRMNRYRRHFSTFYGHPYAATSFYDPFYDPFYDDYWYGGSSIHLNFGWGNPYLYSPLNHGWYNPYRVYASPYYGGWGSSWGYGYYGAPSIYHTRFADNYGPRPSRIGRRGVHSRRGNQSIANEDDKLNSRRSVARYRSQRGGELARGLAVHQQAREPAVLLRLGQLRGLAVHQQAREPSVLLRLDQLRGLAVHQQAREPAVLLRLGQLHGLGVHQHVREPAVLPRLGQLHGLGVHQQVRELAVLPRLGQLRGPAVHQQVREPAVLPRLGQLRGLAVHRLARDPAVPPRLVVPLEVATLVLRLHHVQGNGMETRRIINSHSWRQAH